MTAVTANLPKTIAGITTEIKRCLDAIQSNSMRAGRLLNSSKDFFEKTSEWLDWAKKEFGIGKAQVYKLIKVYVVFGEDARFANASMRVLYVLATEADAEQIELAAKASEEGILDTGFVDRMLHPVKPEPVAPVAPEQEEKGEEKEENGSQPEAPETMPEPVAPVDNQDAPWDDTASEEPTPTVDNVVKATDNDNLKELVQEIKMLREQLANRDAQIQQMQQERNTKPVLPTMPHLRSEHAYIVLGVEPNADKIFAGHRARDLMKMFKGNTEACDLIAAAAKSFKEA